VAAAALYFAAASERCLTVMENISIQPLKDWDDLQAVVDLQRVYWGHDLESVIPRHMLFSIATHGGHVLAALDESRLIGVLVGFLGTTEATGRPAMANLQLVSKRMVVLPEYRGQGVGYKLKLAQRDIAIQQGVRLITWTFDPLLATNAHLNIRKLGAVCHEYRENYYGVGKEGGLATLGSSDRLFVEWWVTNRRVEERLNGNRGDLQLKHYLDANTPIINPTSAETNGTPWPSEKMITPEGLTALVEIPLDYPAIVQRDQALAQAWRTHTRQMFQSLLTKGFVVTDFVRESFEGRDRAFYLLSIIGRGGLEGNNN
jgi:chorismate synthase